MRSALVSVVVVYAMVVTILLFEKAHVAHGGTVASANGDTNGDGTRDISDAVYLLAWLFTGGPEPVPCPGGLPDTGLTKCYSSTAEEIDCGGLLPTICFGQGQDGYLNTGCPNDLSRFTVSVDDTVIDNCTGLQWQRFTGGQLDWCTALEFCEGLSSAGHDDWRLPNGRELLSIVDYGRFGPATDPVFVGELEPYWSSTSSVVPSSAWVVYFETGSASTNTKDKFRYVRAVRTAP